MASLPEIPAEITEFKVDFYLGATVSIDGTAWVKPGVGTSIKWNNLPEENVLKSASKFSMHAVLEPMLEEIMTTVQKHIDEARMAGR